jgi:2,3-bisphosphoglycerate-independent phosphoglycerate mutase
VTPGAKRDFGRGSSPALDEVAHATYLGEVDLTGRGIRRHGSEVSRVRLYGMRTQNGARYLMVHVTASGQVTDYDVVLR